MRPEIQREGKTLMSLKDPIKQILYLTRDYWRAPWIRPWVTKSFLDVLLCGTAAMGANEFRSAAEGKLLFCRCRSKACPSCGYRNTTLWQRDLWCTLPEMPYTGINFTIPSVFWPIFQRDRRLLHDLPRLGANVIQTWAMKTYGVRLLVVVIPQTWGGKLNFNPHLHTLVSSGGLRESDSTWLPSLEFNELTLMHMWRYYIVTYLRTAVQMGIVPRRLNGSNLKGILTFQYEKPWNFYVERFSSKYLFIKYAGRYARRPPIAQNRIARITEREVSYWWKDRRAKKQELRTCSLQEFVALLAEHVPDRYENSVRYFGLLAPYTQRQTKAALYVLLGQTPRQHPPRLLYPESIMRDFGYDPQIDSKGQRMTWAGFRFPVRTEFN
jgi:hypothetical protein